MVRLAGFDDIPQLVEWMLHLKAHTGWSHYVQPGYNKQSLTTFLTTRLLDPQSVCLVWDPGTGITGFCGATLQRLPLPPHMPLVSEWGWYGPPKVAVRCWRAVCEWGSKHGAELGVRATGQHSKSRHIIEQMTYEQLR